MLFKRPATTSDLDRLVREHRAVGRLDEEMIRAIYAQSVEVWAGEFDGEFAGLWGVVTPSICEVALLWLIGTPVIEKHKLPFLRQARAWVKEALPRYGALGGFLEAGCPDRWLEVLGFRLGKTEGDVRRFQQWV